MKAIVLKSKFLKGTNIMAIALYPFILVRNEEYKHDKVLINHEKIHLKQQLEMLIIPFYLWYGAEVLCRFFKGHTGIYLRLSLEREAFHHQDDLRYLERRKRFAWFRYI